MEVEWRRLRLAGAWGNSWGVLFERRRGAYQPSGYTTTAPPWLDTLESKALSNRIMSSVMVQPCIASSSGHGPPPHESGAEPTIHERGRPACTMVVEQSAVVT